MKVDRILKRLTRFPNVINWMILRCNFLGEFLYGKQYRIKQRTIGVPPNEQTFVERINEYIATTPYYAKQYSRVLSLQQFQSNLGFIDKNTVLNDFDAFLSSAYNKKDYVEGTTGGTTGKPMRILMPKGRYGFELPVVHHYWKQFGWNFHVRAVLRNHRLNPNENYRINPLTKEVIFDAFRTDDAYIRFIHGLLVRKNIRFIQAYPSSAYLFCKHCKEMGLDLSFIRAIFTSSEPVHPFQRIFINDELGIPLFNFFGHSEKLMIAGNCGNTDHYHFDPGYGFAELINEEGKPVTTPGQSGELTGTTFNNPGMPLLRFKTGDVATFVGNHCPSCGKPGLVVKDIIGHYHSALVYKFPEGYTTTTALNLHSELYETIDGLQYLQKEAGQLTVFVKPNDRFTEASEKAFLTHFEYAMGAGSRVNIVRTSEFIRLPNGKYPLLVSQLRHDAHS